MRRGEILTTELQTDLALVRFRLGSYVRLIARLNSARKRIIIGVAAVALVTLACLFIFRSPAREEPTYQGKTLTQWLKRLDNGEALGISSSHPEHFTEKQLEAAAAIRAIGTNALPFLMTDVLCSPDPNSARVKFYEWVNQVVFRFTSTWAGFGSVTEEDRIRWRAAQGLAALGPLAKSAIPELNRLLLINHFHSSIKEAAYALGAMGPDGLAVLTNTVPSQNEWSAMCAIWALGRHPTAGSNALPFLIDATTSWSEGTACGAIQVLGLLRTEPDLVIPVLSNALQSTNRSVAHDAVGALAKYGKNATAAMEILGSLTNHAELGPVASEALQKVQ